MQSDPFYMVTYDGNGSNVGSPPIDGILYEQADTATVAGAGSMARRGYIFAGWSTQPDGGGLSYSAGDTISIETDNVTLYAKWTADPSVPSISGSGTAEDPYLVTSAEQLAAIRDSYPLDKAYKLMNDIDLTDYLASGGPGYNGGKGWQPIGANTAGLAFTGTFDGNGKKITGLWSSRSGEDYVGLFGYADKGAKITRLTVELAAPGMTGEEYVGGLVGYLKEGTVEYCRVDGTVTGAGTSSFHVGGLVGHVGPGGSGAPLATVRASFSTGKVIGTGTIDIGGLVGMNDGRGTVIDSYSLAEVQGGLQTGGLIGENRGTLTNSFAAGKVTGSSSVGGLIGQNNNMGDPFLGSYWDKLASRQTASSGGTGQTTAFLQSGTVLSGWDTSVWAFSEGSYPQLRWTLVPTPPAAPVDLTAVAGDGQVALSWSSVTGAAYYDIYQGSATGSYGASPIKTVTGTTYTVTGLANGTVYYFAVKAGNDGGASDAYSNEASAMPMAEAPLVLTPVSLSSSNPAPRFAKTGDTVTLTFAANKALGGTPVVTIAGRSADVATVSANVYQVLYTFAGTEAEGNIPFTIDFEDAQGNAGAQVAATTDGSSVMFDKTAPTGTLSINGGAAETGSASVTLTAASNDGMGSGDVQMRFSGDNLTWNPWEPFASAKSWMLSPGDGSKTVYMQLRDAAGNITAPAITATIRLRTSSSSSSSSTTDSSAASDPQKETIKINVEDGKGGKGAVVSNALISRTTDANGRKKDEVSFTPEQAAITVVQLAATGSDLARLVIPDPKDEVAELVVTLPKSATEQLAGAGIGLEIHTVNGRIDIPKESLAELKDDIYFRVVPIKAENERKTIEERVRTERLVREAAGNDGIDVVGRPMTIETNLSSRPVSLVLPLGDWTTSEQRTKSLGVFIEHSDGTKELVRGQIVAYDDTGKPGIRFTVTKFSTFTVVGMNDMHKAYIAGYPDGTFGPDKSITRAEMAAILASMFHTENHRSTPAYQDVTEAHWADEAIVQAAQSGLMQGYPDGSFKPDQPISRGEMASIAAKLLSGHASGGGIFPDAKGHWAKSFIAQAEAARVMSGFPDGTFRPDQALTRAEAVTIINRLLGRGPLSGTEPRWADVPPKHWAYEQIQEASVDHAAEPKPAERN
ncbi:S-layer homology domain-containing protein [Cohnella caldifontis]|uniref:S-layer homology domain-containing protein n=1 Tax=Cohnella caldifontis TaxID=3027471 RepID=UPI0023ED27B3|nr:S-layer homology domain-containing protein [Cohnella sp. YIM B05605]